MRTRMAVLAKAIGDLEGNRFAAVASRCAPLLARDRHDIEASLLAGLAAGARGLTDRAAGLLHRAARGRGDAAHPLRDLAAILRRIGRPDLLEPQFHALRRLAPEDVSLLYLVCRIVLR